MRCVELGAIIGMLLLVACGHDAAPDAGPDSGPVVLCPPWDGGTGDAGPTDVPFNLVPLLESDGDGGTYPFGVRFAVQFEIERGGPVNAYVDTGSSGIQLLQAAVPPAVIAALDGIGTDSATEEFESGIEATGVTAYAYVTFGKLTTPSPIKIFLIQKLSCAAGFACADSENGLQQDLFNGFQAILGVGLRASLIAPGLGSPIPRLPGNPPFIVKAPAFGGSAGTLRIGPSVAEISTFHVLQLPTETDARPIAQCLPAWDDSAVPACVDDQTAVAQFCADALLDTGGPATLIDWLGYQGPAELPAGDAVAVSVGPTGAPLGQFDLVVGSDPQPGQDLFLLAPSSLGANLINLGTTVFYRYDVYFNQAQGQIGLLLH